MKQLQFLIKPAAGYCNMRCQYCFYRDEQQNRVNPEDCMMTRATAETLIQRCFVEIEQGGFVYRDDDPDQLAKVLEHDILHPDQLAAMKADCRKMYEKYYSNEAYVATLTRLVNELTT